MADIVVLQNSIGVSFDNPALLTLALTHSSYVHENHAAPGSNERLEFLGDAVLGLVIGERLYLDYPDLAEGEMTRLRSVVVRREALARAAAALGLGDYLYLGKGEEASGGRSKPANLASLLEAVIAAVYLDRGLAAARDFTLRALADELRQVAGRETAVDYKSRLQEMVQSRLQGPPAYRLLSATGPDHARTFIVEVLVGGRVLGQGSGKSKKLAEAEAARAALERDSGDFTA